MVAFSRLALTLFLASLSSAQSFTDIPQSGLPTRLLPSGTALPSDFPHPTGPPPSIVPSGGPRGSMGKGPRPSGGVPSGVVGAQRAQESDAGFPFLSGDVPSGFPSVFPSGFPSGGVPSGFPSGVAAPSGGRGGIGKGQGGKSGGVRPTGPLPTGPRPSGAPEGPAPSGFAKSISRTL